MLDFSQFDRRRYPTVSVREGYREWLPSYETTVEDEMDLVLLERLESIPWSAIRRAADLGCGTGRTGASLRARGVARIDGIDLTPEMIAAARDRVAGMKPRYRCLNSMIGRTSMLPRRATGIFEATWMASFRSLALMRMNPPSCSFVSAKGPSVIDSVSFRIRTVMAVWTGWRASEAM